MNDGKKSAFTRMAEGEHPMLIQYSERFGEEPEPSVLLAALNDGMQPNVNIHGERIPVIENKMYTFTKLPTFFEVVSRNHGSVFIDSIKTTQMHHLVKEESEDQGARFELYGVTNPDNMLVIWDIFICKERITNNIYRDKKQLRIEESHGPTLHDNALIQRVSASLLAAYVQDGDKLNLVSIIKNAKEHNKSVKKINLTNVDPMSITHKGNECTIRAGAIVHIIALQSERSELETADCLC